MVPRNTSIIVERDSTPTHAIINCRVATYRIFKQVCYKDYPGLGNCYIDYVRLGNRSVFYPYNNSSVGNTFTFDVVQVTTSNPTSNVSFTETLARAHLKNASPWFPR